MTGQFQPFLLLIAILAGHLEGVFLPLSEFPNYLVTGYPPIYDEIGVGNFYGKTIVVFKEIKLNWMEAHIKCRSHGMELTSFDSQEEFEYQAELVKNNMQNPPMPDYAWISAHDLLNEGRFTWLYSGKPFSSFYNTIPRHTNQPDNWNQNEHCMEFSKEGLETEFWVNDTNCEIKNGVVCTYVEKVKGCS